MVTHRMDVVNYDLGEEMQVLPDFITNLKM